MNIAIKIQDPWNFEVAPSKYNPANMIGPNMVRVCVCMCINDVMFGPVRHRLNFIIYILGPVSFSPLVILHSS